MKITWLDFQVYGTILVASHLVAYLTARPWGMAYWVEFATVSAILCLVWRKHEDRSRRQWRRNEDALRTRIESMSIQEARGAAHEVLRDPAKFRTTPVVDTCLPQGEQLPSAVRELFGLYSSIEVVAGEARLSQDLISASEFHPGWIRIGTDIDFTEIAVRPGDEGVYEFDGSESTQKDFDQACSSSVYHWIVMTPENLYGA